MGKKKFKEEENLKESSAEEQNTAYAENDEVEVVEEETEKSEQTEQSEELKAEEAKKAEEENLQNKLLRLQADFLNYKNRTEKEKIATYGNASADVLKDLLPVVDNLERALEADASNESSLKEGVQMIYAQLMGILDKKGLKEIEALHKPFDANIHYGVAFDSECEAEDNTVIEVFQKGYIFNDKVVRPSMVKIAKK